MVGTAHHRGDHRESRRRPRPGPGRGRSTTRRARTLRQRELAKAAELAAAGHRVPLSTLQRLRLSYEKRGVWGLVDHRAAPRPGARTDKRVLEAIAQAVGEETDRSTGTVEPAAAPGGADPGRRARHRPGLGDAGAGRRSTGWPRGRPAGKHTFGSARTRRSAAKAPARPVRHGDRGAAGRVDADRLHPAGRAGRAGQRHDRPGRADLAHRHRDPDHPGGGAADVDQGRRTRRCCWPAR